MELYICMTTEEHRIKTDLPRKFWPDGTLTAYKTNMGFPVAAHREFWELTPGINPFYIVLAPLGMTCIWYRGDILLQQTVDGPVVMPVAVDVLADREGFEDKAREFVEITSSNMVTAEEIDRFHVLRHEIDQLSRVCEFKPFVKP